MVIKMVEDVAGRCRGNPDGTAKRRNLLVPFLVEPYALLSYESVENSDNASVSDHAAGGLSMA